MITKNYLNLMIIISYAIGFSGGYILKNSPLISIIASIIVGIYFVIYIVPEILIPHEK